MNLTYELTENGYKILNNGVVWIEQENYIPYPGETIEASAQNHIDQLLKDVIAEETQANDIEQLQEDNAMVAETLALALEEIEQLKVEINTIKGE